MVAFKPISKQDILARLNKDNMLSDKERETLENLIQTVTIYNKAKSWHELSNETMLNDVKEDWPFFSNHEKMIVKKNIANIKQQLMNTSSSSSSSQMITSQTMPAGAASSAFVSLKSSRASLPNTSLDTSLNDSKSTPTSSSSNTQSNNSKRTSSPHKAGPEQFKPILPTSKQQQQQQAQKPSLCSPDFDMNVSTGESSTSNSGATSKKTNEKENNYQNMPSSSSGGVSSNSNGNSNKKFKSNFLDKQKEIEQAELSECAK